MPPDILENLKSDMIAVLSRYFDVDTNSLDVNVERGKRSRLITTITIKRNR
jgi:septum formation topological specificity factor MinE